MSSKYYIYGKHTSIKAILNPNRLIHKILLSEGFSINYLLELLNNNYYTKKLIKNIVTVSNRELTKILGFECNHQGIAVLTEKLKQPNISTFLNKFNNTQHCTLAILDQVTDTTNIGSILRSAAAFGVQAIIVPKFNSAKETSGIAKTACGALETIPLLNINNLCNILNILKKYNFWIVGLDSKAELDKVNLINNYNKVVLVFGNEHTGLRRLTKTYCDILLKIPFINNSIESLNLSNAAAITFYLRFSKGYNEN